MNIYNKETTMNNTYLNSKGKILRKEGVALSDFIEVSTPITLTSRGYLKGTKKEVHTIGIYDKDKKFISHVFVNDKYTPILDIKYIRVNIGSDNINSLILEVDK